MSSTKPVVSSKPKASQRFSAFEFSNIIFHSVQDDTFRIKVTPGSENVLVWLESKKTRRQFQTVVIDISKHGIVGIPEVALFTFIKMALEACVTPPDDFMVHKIQEQKAPVEHARVPENINANIDLDLRTDKAVLSALIDFGMWKQECEFIMDPVPLEPIDILTAKLRDAQEEIDMLRGMMIKAPREALFSTLMGRLNTLWNAGAICPWGDMEGTDLSLISVATNHTDIHILKDGWYQISVSCHPASAIHHTWVAVYTLTVTEPAFTKAYSSDLTVTLHLTDKSIVLLTNQAGANINWGESVSHLHRPHISFTYLADFTN